MTIKELKSQCKGLLASSRSSLIYKGQAFSAIIKKYNAFGGDCLSDNMLISDLAEEYIAEEKQLYAVSKSEEHLEKIKGARTLIETNPLSTTEVKALIGGVKSPYTFESIKKALEPLAEYDRIHPTAVKTVMEEVYGI